MQLVEIRERIVFNHEGHNERKEDNGLGDLRVLRGENIGTKPKLFANLRKMELMSFGVPEEWIEDVRRADEDNIFDVLEHLPTLGAASWF
jgi:hypothetical protein